jgi:2',3'-cyclic-nucleotide 2'-phosphodiesterase (5'-nucleotidase family)
MPERLTIIHTNDFHGRLSDAAAERLGRLRGEFSGALLLDAGDAVSAGNLGCRVGGEPILARMSELGYDAMTVGNRESHPRKELFPRKIDWARFPVLCANLVGKPGVPVPTVPWVALERSGLRIAVFGLTVPMFTRKMWSQALCDYLFEDPLETARDLVPRLREQADIVIGLTHIGLKQDQALAAGVPGIDVILGGHTHADLAEPVQAAGVPILHTTAYAFYAGVAHLEVAVAGSDARRDGERRCTRLASWQRVPLRERA